MNLSKEEVKKVASLAKLFFQEDELDEFVKQFNDILEYVRLIEQCDTDGIEDVHNLDGYSDKVLQEDETCTGLSREKALMNATDRVLYGYVKTSQIVSKD